MGTTRTRLRPELTTSMSRNFRNLKKYLEEECLDYALFRGEFYSEDNGDLCLDLLGSDIDGCFKRLSMSLDAETGDIYYSKGFKLKNEKKVREAIYDFIAKIEGSKPPISHLYFEFCPDFVTGIIEKDPKEAGSIILYMLGVAATENGPNVCITDAISSVGHNLAGNWRKKGREI